MKNHQLAMAYLNQAAEILHEVEEARQRRVWNWSVRRSQEVVELSLSKQRCDWLGLKCLTSTM